MLLSLWAAPAALRATPTGAAAAQQAAPTRERPLRLLIRLKAGSSPAWGDRAPQAQELQARELRAWAEQRGLAVRSARGLGGRFATLTLDKSADTGDASASLAALAADPEVEYAAVDQRRFAHAVPTDALYGDQWYLQGVQPGASNFQAAWDVTAGDNDTVIAVLDTGVIFDHPDLGRSGQGGRLLPGYDFVDGESSASFVAANDGNGWDADASDPGDWVTPGEAASGPLSGCQVEDSSWHGTRVTAMVGALANNGAGMAGGTWASRVLPVRVLGKCGGYDSDIIAGMRWAAGLSVPGVPANPYPAQIINLSLGSPDTCSTAYRNVMTELNALGILVVASAGNENGPVDTPANCPGVLAVAGVRHVGTKVGYSSLGPEVAIAAPAGNCPTQDQTGLCEYSLLTATDTGATAPAQAAYTDTFNPNIGTSFSAPIVSAIAGLMHGVNAGLRASDYIARIKAGARPFPTDPAIPVCPQVAPETFQCNCTTTTCGAGLADAPGAVAEALRPLARVVQPSGTTAGRNVTLDGSGSAAARSRTLASYNWSVVSGTASFVGAADADTAVVAVPPSGLVTVRLDVADDNGATDSAEVTLGSTAPIGSSGGGSGGGGALDPLLLAGLVLLARRRRRPQL